jgi:hypothetical protein
MVGRIPASGSRGPKEWLLPLLPMNAAATHRPNDASRLGARGRNNFPRDRVKSIKSSTAKS